MALIWPTDRSCCQPPCPFFGQQIGPAASLRVPSLANKYVGQANGLPSHTLVYSQVRRPASLHTHFGQQAWLGPSLSFVLANAQQGHEKALAEGFITLILTSCQPS
jgi:hypothetical protein